MAPSAFGAWLRGASPSLGCPGVGLRVLPVGSVPAWGAFWAPRLPSRGALVGPLSRPLLGWSGPSVAACATWACSAHAVARPSWRTRPLRCGSDWLSVRTLRRAWPRGARLACAAVPLYRAALGRPRAPWLGHGPLPLLGGLVLVGWLVGWWVRFCGAALRGSVRAPCSPCPSLLSVGPYHGGHCPIQQVRRGHFKGFSYCLASSVHLHF